MIGIDPGVNYGHNARPFYAESVLGFGRSDDLLGRLIHVPTRYHLPELIDGSGIGQRGRYRIIGIRYGSGKIELRIDNAQLPYEFVEERRSRNRAGCCNEKNLA